MAIALLMIPRFSFGQDSRVYVDRIFQAANLHFAKEKTQSALVFQLSPGDSIRIDCHDCLRNLQVTSETGRLGISLNGTGKSQAFQPAMIGCWLPVQSGNGRIGVVFERDGFGEKWISIASLSILRKSKLNFTELVRTSTLLLEATQFCLGGPKENDPSASTKLFFKLRGSDQIQVDLLAADGHLAKDVACSIFRNGEEFAKKPLAMGSYVSPSADQESIELYGFELSQAGDVGPLARYHLKVSRRSSNGMTLSTTTAK